MNTSKKCLLVIIQITIVTEQGFIIVFLVRIFNFQALKAADQIWIVTNMDSKEDIAYPNNPKVMMTVDDDLKQMFRGIELPKDMVDIEKELQMAGMKPATNSTQRRAVAQILIKNTQPKPRKCRQLNRRSKLTNAHLPELFQDISAFRF